MSDIEKNTKLLKESEVFYTTFEPKTQTRFMVYLTDHDGKAVLPAWLIKDITRPKVQWSHTLRAWTWLPIIIRTYDPIVPSATQMFYSYMLERKQKLFDVMVNVLGPVGDTVEKWEIKDAKFSQIDFGELSWEKYSPTGKERLEHLNMTRYYKGDGPVEITAVITYDVAKLIY